MGGAAGTWDEANPAAAMQAPADQNGEWVSPAFTATGELRAYIHIPNVEWWRTEFTLLNGSLYFRDINIPENWAANAGAEYSVSCAPGQKLYVNFDKNTGEVK